MLQEEYGIGMQGLPRIFEAYNFHLRNQIKPFWWLAFVFFSVANAGHDQKFLFTTALKNGIV